MGVQALLERVERLASVASARKLDDSEAAICPKCKGYRVVAVLATGEEVPFGDIRLITQRYTTRECSCAKELKMRRLFESARIPEKFWSASFKQFEVTGRAKCVREARDTAFDYLLRFDEIKQSKHNSIMLLGAPGSGKTHLLAAVTRGLIERGILVHYFPWVEGFNELRDNMDALQERMQAMQSVDVLFVDDLYKGGERPTSWELKQLYAVVNHRYLNSLPIMVSSEKDIDTLFEIDEAIASRLLEMTKGHRVQMALTEDEQAAGLELNYRLR